MVQLKIKIWTKRKIKRFRESIDKKVIFEWGVIAVLLFIVYFMFNYLLMPQINLNGGKHIVINYKDNYFKDWSNIFYDIAEKLEIPIASGFKISHDKQKLTLPYGIECEFNAKEGEIKLLENIFIA